MCFQLYPLPKLLTASSSENKYKLTHAAGAHETSHQRMMAEQISADRRPSDAAMFHETLAHQFHC